MTRRRRNAKDLLTPDPTPDRQLIHPSGWCITGHHDGCRYQFSHGKCGCDCHVKPKFVEMDTKTASSGSPKRRGRPKKVQNVAPSNQESEYIDPRPWVRKDK